MKPRILIFLLFPVLLGGCVSLTPRGSAITVVNSMSTELTSDCKRLGAVIGKAKAGWGNDVGLEQAYTDARNKAGEIPEADTIAISSTNRKFSGGEVSGIVFDCSKKRIQLTQEVPAVKPLTSSSDDIFRMAKKCQAKGGVWVTNQCVISLE